MLLSSFGIFFIGEGLGTHWPGDDAALLYLIVTLGSISQAHAHRLARDRRPA